MWVKTNEGSSLDREKLTRQQAIKEHRKMWRWIADQYKSVRYKDAGHLEVLATTLMHAYAKEHWTHPVRNDCMLCQYTVDAGDGVHVDCALCPIDWLHGGVELGDAWTPCTALASINNLLMLESVKLACMGDDSSGSRVQSCVKYAAAIAELPEKEGQANG